MLDILLDPLESNCYPYQENPQQHKNGKVAVEKICNQPTRCEVTVTHKTKSAKIDTEHWKLKIEDFQGP